MTKKKIMKNIKTPNKFEDGGYWKDVANNASLYGIGSGVGSLIGGNYDAGDNVSNILSTAGAAAAFIPGPWGAVASTALSAAGGLYNRAFGTDWNEAGLATAENNINTLKNFNSGATTYDALIADINNINNLNTKVEASDLGKDGWRSNKTVDKANSLNKANAAAYNTAMRNINVTADNIAADTLANLERNYAALGGLLNRTHGADFTNGLMFINSGGTHESNPYEGVPVSMDQEGNPNLVEEGEVIWNDYVFSNRLKVPKSIQKKYKLGKREMTFANAVDKLSKESEERPNDPISIRGLESMLTNMAIEQETIKSKKQTSGKNNNKFATGGPAGIYNYEDVDNGYYITSTGDKTAGIQPEVRNVEYVAPTPTHTPEVATGIIDTPETLPTWMRYAPVIGQGALAITDAFGLTNKPDYSNANNIIEAAKRASVYNPVRFKPIGDYLTYNPFDTEYHANQLRAQTGATRRNIMNTSGGNRATAMAGLLAADYNANNALGDLYRKANEYNLEQRQKVADFNRATNITNSEGLLKAAMANQSASAQAKALGLEGLMTGYKMKEQAKLTSDQAKSANISGLLTSLGNMGYENANRNMMYWGMANGTWAPSQWKYDPLTGKPVK